MTTEAQSQPETAPTPGVLPTTPSGRAQLARSQARARFVSAEEGEASAKTEAPPAKAEPDRDVKPANVPEPPAQADKDDGDESPTRAAPAPAPVAKADDKPDRETERRLAKVQEAEKRGREKLAGERAELEKERAAAAKERAELEAERKELAEYRKARDRAKTDPVAYLRAAGVTDPADLEYAARAAYAAGKPDANNREAAARMMRDRESDDRYAALERRNEELAKRLDERDRRDQEREQAAHVEREAARYVDGLKTAATGDKAGPLTKRLFAGDPRTTEAELRQLAYEMSRENEEVPDHEDVLARYEERQRKLAARYGVDPSTLTDTPPKTNSQPAAKKPAAPTLANNLSAPSVPRWTSDRMDRADVRQRFIEGRD